jgi:hypothetical protein
VIVGVLSQPERACGGWPYELAPRDIVAPTTSFLEQFGGGTGLGAGGLGVGLQGQGIVGPLGTRFIPMLNVSERYDSNVFFAPKIPGLRLEDYVTTVSPQLFVQDSRALAFTTFNVGAIGEYYAVHQGLNYIGFNAGIASNLSPLVQRYIPGAAVRISNAYIYTPNPPGFLNRNQSYSDAVSTSIIDELPVADQYVRSVQAFRVNTKANTFNISAAYPISPRVGMQGSYTYATLDFGNNFVPEQRSSEVTFNSFTTHTVTLGPTARVSPRDTVVGAYSYSQTEGTVKFDSHQATLGWTRLLAPNWVARIFGGAALLQQEGTPSEVIYTGGASIFWAEGRTNVGLTYSAGVVPSYVTSGGALLSNAVTLGLTHQLLTNLLGSIGGGYGRDISIISGANQPDLFFETVQAYARVTYIVSRAAALNLNYTFSYNKGTFSVSSPGEKDEINRQTIALTLTTFWQP